MSENSVNTQKTEVKERKQPSKRWWYGYPKIQKTIINQGNDRRNNILMSLNFP